MTTNPTLGVVVLAAGEGTRMRSALPKVLHPVCGTPMLGHVLQVAASLGAQDVVVVLSEATLEPVRQTFGTAFQYAVQHDRRGTGHAVLQARAALQGRTDQVIVLYGDSPLIKASTARRLVAMQHASGAKVALVSFHADPPTGYGRVVRGPDGQVQALVEEKNATPEQRAITEVNSGVMCFDAAWLWQQIDQIPLNPAKNEYYLTDLAEMAVRQHGAGATVASQTDDPREAWGANDRAQLALLEAAMRERLIADLLAAGVTITDPAATYVEAGVVIGADTTLLPGCVLRGTTVIGAGCIIGPYTTIEHATIGDGAHVRHAVVERAQIPAGSRVGPFAHVVE